MFIEYSMASEPKFGDDFGFSEREVDLLYEKYYILYRIQFQYWQIFYFPQKTPYHIHLFY